MDDPEITDEELEQYLKEIGVSDFDDDTKGYGSPEPEKKDSLFQFFRELLYLKESKKVGNLDKPELGLPDVSVRNAFDIAVFAQSQGLGKVADYFEAKAGITLDTSLTKKGFLPQLFVTQIKKDQKISSSPTIEKKGIFGKKTVEVSDNV